MDWTIGVRFPAGAIKGFILFATSSEAHPASYPMGTEGFSLKQNASV
jgi:hypothetical protein